MRSFSDPSLFLLIDSLCDEGAKDSRSYRWTDRGTDWSRRRYSIVGPEVRFVMDELIISCSKPRKWSMLVVRETWWSQSDDVIRSSRWAKPLTGSRSDIWVWLRAEQRRVEVPAAAGGAGQ